MRNNTFKLKFFVKSIDIFIKTTHNIYERWVKRNESFQSVINGGYKVESLCMPRPFRSFFYFFFLRELIKGLSASAK